MSEIDITLKQKLNIVEIISQYTQLEKKGNYYWYRCPFHKDLHPSMSVNPVKGTYKCFACGSHGDSISFLAGMQNKSREEYLSFNKKIKNSDFEL